MPGLRTLSVLSVLAACLAQAWAGPQFGHGEAIDPYKSGTGRGAHGGNRADQQQKQADAQSLMTVTMTETMTQAQAVSTVLQVQTEMSTVTVTITAVAACTGSVVTAYVSSCSTTAAASGVSPLPVSMAPGTDAVGNGQAPVFTTIIPNFSPGLSSIPATQAVLTGNTIAAAAAPAPTPSTSDSTSTSTMTSTLTTTATISTGSSGPDAASAPFAGSTFTTSGTIVPGLGSIPNTNVPAATGVAAAPAVPQPGSTVNTATLSLSNAGTLGIGKRFVVVPTDAV